MNTPSRDFMVRQAVLNAAHAECDFNPLGALSVLDRVSRILGYLPGNFIVAVHREFRTLAAQYSEAA